MTTKTNTFSFAGLELRSVTIEGKPWFVAADVLRFLYPRFNGNAGVSPWLKTLRQNEVQPVGTLGTSLGIPAATKLIAESGLYTLVMRAQTKNPKAAEFQNWVTGTVLPAIRKDGMYVQGEEKLDPNNDAWTGSTNPLWSFRKAPLTAN
ncbi:BRO-N domain-containing protein [Methylobacterium sp. NFXW15]|uniref:BRO-N domain-containing protein n=1 Tax=Methylobacterium sp. NFXW15 TaxID=2819512 RepID=UPI003CE8966B